MSKGVELMPFASDVFHGGGEAAEILRGIDWDARSMGPVETWPQSLRTALSICLSSRYPICILWGEERIYFYNDGYTPILGAKHPWALGQPYPKVWPEIWESDIKPILEKVETSGEASWCDNLLLVLERHGFKEECYFSFSFAPIRVEDGSVGGVFTAITETTPQVVGERRLRTLRDLGARAPDAKTAPQACDIIAEVVEGNAHDVPFALMYLLDEEGKVARLQGKVRVGAEVEFPREVPLENGNGNEGWPFAEVVATGQAVTFEEVEKRFGQNKAGPWPEPVRSAYVLPISRPGQAVPYGFLVAGVSPRRKLDADYQSFLALMASQTATALSNALSYEEERKRAEQLAEIDRAKTTFFSNVSHEFRTPLTLMLGPLEELLQAGDDVLSERARQELKVTHRNSLRLLKLVNTLLDFSRIEAGRVQARYEATNLGEVTRDLASVFRAAIEKAGLRFTVNCCDEGDSVYVDRDMWEKIVLNLLSNAYKFTLEGEIEVSLKAAGEDWMELKVRDTGSGIPQEELPNLFKRFHRVEGAKGRTFEGTGIGLALIQELVKLHGGEISVQSELGIGTEFTVRLKRGKGHLPAEKVSAGKNMETTRLRAEAFVEEALRWVSEERSGEEFSALGRELLRANSRQEPEGAGSGSPSLNGADRIEKRRRILVADDNADMRDYLSRLLKRSYEVVLASDGETAWQLAKKERPDLVLSDVMMPGMDGFALLRALREDTMTQSIPLILLSARAGEESRVEGLDAGADDYLIKPFSAQELHARVNAHLKLAELRRQAEEQLEKTVQERTARLQESLNDLEAFSYSISHDMRAPLRAMNGYAQALIEEAPHLDEKRREYLQRIARSATRLDALIQDVLNYSRVAREEVTLKKIDLEAVVREIMEEYPQLHPENADIEIASPLIKVNGHEVLLMQCISNLLVNAVKFVREGQRPRVRVRTEEVGGKVRIWIEDNGIGIAANNHARVFGIFQRINPDQRYEGTGIGLAICKKAVERMGGKIGVESEEGKGSRFWIEVEKAHT